MSIEINSTQVYYESTKIYYESKTQVKNTEETPVEEIKDTYEKSSQYQPDLKKVDAMKTELNQKIGAFQKMVSSLLKKQGGYGNQANGLNDLLKSVNEGRLGEFMAGLEVDEQTRLEAQAQIAEDGYWGVEKTAGRILDFAKALSGGDPAKIDLLKNAFIKGFKDAEQAWGGTLPEISQKTYDRVMEGFKEWEESAAPSEEIAAEA